MTADESALVACHWLGPGAVVQRTDLNVNLHLVLPLDKVEQVRLHEVTGRVSFIRAELYYRDPLVDEMACTTQLEFWPGADQHPRSDYRDPKYWKVFSHLMTTRPDLVSLV